MTKKRTALDRILSAFNHPVRRRILRELVDSPASASMLSRKLRVELGTVSYHLGAVLDRQCKVVELVDSVQRRGSVEKIYGLRGFDGPLLDLPAAGEPGSREEMAWTIALAQRLYEATRGSR